MLKDRKGSYLGNVRLALWALASVAALWSFSGVAMAEKRVALVVGNAAYQHVTKLANTRNDATAMAEALRQLNFDVILEMDLDSSSFVEKLKEFNRKTQGASAALFFYAGHASQYQDKNYLTPIDATEVKNQLDYRNHIELNEEVMDIMQSGTRLVFLDACRDNPLDKPFKSRSTGSASRGLARLPGTNRESYNGSYIAYATAPGQTAKDGAPGGNSPFTKALLEHIRIPNLSVSDIITSVRGLVIKNTEGWQRPWEKNLLTKPFYFSRSEAVTPSPLSVSSSKPPGVYLRVGAAAAQKIEESHLEVVAKNRIPAHEINGYPGVGGGCYSKGISAGTRLAWDHIALCSR